MSAEKEFKNLHPVIENNMVSNASLDFGRLKNTDLVHGVALEEQKVSGDLEDWDEEDRDSSLEERLKKGLAKEAVGSVIEDVNGEVRDHFFIEKTSPKEAAEVTRVDREYEKLQRVAKSIKEAHEYDR